MEEMKRFTEKTLTDLRNGCNVTIVAYGDSITAGYAVRRGFPTFWKEMLVHKYPGVRIELISSGISGDTTMDGLARLDWAVLSYEPDLVTINFGINDCVYGLGVEEFEALFLAALVLAAATKSLKISKTPTSSSPRSPPKNRNTQDASVTRH